MNDDDYNRVPAKVTIGGVWMSEEHYNNLMSAVKERDVLLEALEWLRSGICRGMFGTQSKSAQDDFYEMAPKVVQKALHREGQ